MSVNRLYSYIFMMFYITVRKVCSPKFRICLARLYFLSHFRTRAERMKWGDVLGYELDRREFGFDRTLTQRFFAEKTVVTYENY